MRMQYKLAELQAEHRASGQRYHEFIKVADLSTGLYVLPTGAEDTQQPHTEDEIYYVIGGQARFWVDGQGDVAVGPGDTLFVAAHVPHRFHTITQELSLLVVFAPARGSRASVPSG